MATILEAVRQRFVRSGGRPTLPGESYPIDAPFPNCPPQPHAAIDATCIDHGRQVLLKKYLPETAPNELPILRMFSSSRLRDDPHNHCIPLLDEIDLSNNDRKLLVMPLFRRFNNPLFQTYGEFVAFFTQICEVVSNILGLSCQTNPDAIVTQGLQFMHKKNVAHR